MDPIDRQAARDVVYKAFADMHTSSRDRLAEIDYGLLDLQSAQTCEYWDSESKFCALCRPSAQPERKKGRWIRNDNGTYSCSVCQSWIPEEQHCYARYCLYCGADMRKEEMIE